MKTLEINEIRKYAVVDIKTGFCFKNEVTREEALDALDMESNPCLTEDATLCERGTKSNHDIKVFSYGCVDYYKISK